VATFAKKQLSILRSVSPTSLKVTLEQLRRGAKMHLSDCFKMEYRMVRQFLSTPDFIEGVSAKLLEKREPVWTPSLTDMSLITPAVVDLKFFEKKVNMKDLELYNRISYYDYPHRTLSGLPTDKDVQRVLMGEGRRHVTSLQPHTKREVKEWIGQNWGRYDSGIVGDSNSSQLPTRLALDGGYGRGKVGLMEKVEAILERHTKETENGLKWIN
jgi:3-hydroxyisobutyryl-CoA hydrolase